MIFKLSKTNSAYRGVNVADILSIQFLYHLFTGVE